MNLRVPGLRLLPVTIAMLSLVLAAKTALLLRAAFVRDQPTALITNAWAGGHEAKPEGKPAGAPDHGKPEKPEPMKPSAPEHGKPATPEHGKSMPPEPQKAEEKPPVPEGPPPMSESEKAVLLELRERRQELEVRETDLSGRESMLTAAEKKVSSRVEELQGLQKKLESLDASHRQQEDNAWQGLVKVYETMKPREAAAIFNDLAMPVLLSVLDRMKEAKAAAILAAMSPDRAREVTMQLALSRTRAAASPETARSAANPASPRASGSGT